MVHILKDSGRGDSDDEIYRVSSSQGCKLGMLWYGGEMNGKEWCVEIQ